MREKKNRETARQSESLISEGIPVSGQNTFAGGECLSEETPVHEAGELSESEKYVKTVSAQIRCKMARKSLEAEMRQHIEEQTEEYLMEGMDRETAEREAVRQMGDPVETGAELDRIHRPSMPWKTILMITVLSVVGLGMRVLLQENTGADMFLSGNVLKQCGLILAGLTAMIAVCMLDYSRIGQYVKYILCILYVFSAAGLWMFGRRINGAVRWIELSGVSINITNMAVLFVPLYAAVLYGKRKGGYGDLIRSLLWMLPEVLILWYAPNRWELAFLVVCLAVTLTVAVNQGWFSVKKKLVNGVVWGGMFGIPAVSVLLLLRQDGYQARRLLAFAGNRTIESWQQVQIGRMLAGSKMIGSGSGPMADVNSADNVLSFFIAYYGMFAAALLIAAILALFFHLLRVSMRQQNQLGFLMGVSISLAFLLRILFYVMENTGCLPVVTVSECPFLSYGGTGIIVTYMMMGVILSICRYQNVMPHERIPGNAAQQV